MIVIDFLKDRNRMCEYYAPECEVCLAANAECHDLQLMADDDNIGPIVEQWSQEHPRKTRQDVFF